MSKPSILISNDDGIFAPGIYALWQAMSEIGDTIVVAPNTEKSAVGHAITISDPIRIEEVRRSNGFKGYAVNGTPADSVKIAVKSIMKDKPDIIVSGINAGANVGQSLLYSGTISAASEGTLLGIPSIAISLDALRDMDFSTSKVVAKKIVNKVLEYGLPNETLLNINKSKNWEYNVSWIDTSPSNKEIGRSIVSRGYFCKTNKKNKYDY